MAILGPTSYRWLRCCGSRFTCTMLRWKPSSARAVGRPLVLLISKELIIAPVKTLVRFTPDQRGAYPLPDHGPGSSPGPFLVTESAVPCSSGVPAQSLKNTLPTLTYVLALSLTHVLAPCQTPALRGAVVSVLCVSCLLSMVLGEFWGWRLLLGAGCGLLRSKLINLCPTKLN